ncbi:VOC family protein [Ferruginibacter sp. SUN106]|uniref:VOC family protein n=1 Tax=Ferruginibacter sp. SUN106 TaxID=2978348 RepID=UPI003D3626C3
MKRSPLLFAIAFLFSLHVHAQSRLGDVACVYVTTPNLDSSFAVYEKLGFAKTGANDFPTPWMQLSDGSLLIMMRKDATPYIGLTYYAADVEKLVAELEKDSIVFTQKPKAGDLIKRYYFKSPDGFNIMLASNLGGFKQPAGLTLLTMPQADYTNADKFPNKQCGAFGEFAQPVTDINVSVAFWKKLGFTTKMVMKEPYPYTILSDGLMIIGLHQTKHFDYPAVTYFGLNTNKRIQDLKTKGLNNFSEVQGKNNVALKTWEGQHFFIFSLGM